MSHIISKNIDSSHRSMLRRSLKIESEEDRAFGLLGE